MMFSLELWLLVAYAAGTMCGWYLAYRKAHTAAVEFSLDQLINQGFIKHRRTNTGEIEIIKWNEDFD